MSRHRSTRSWYADWDALRSEDEQHQFLVAFNQFCEYLAAGDPSRALEEMPVGLAVTDIEGSPGIYQLKWGEDRYATFSFDGVHPDEKGRLPIVWRRMGKAVIFTRP